VPQAENALQERCERDAEQEDGPAEVGEVFLVVVCLVRPI
jgi:hypothetical protein